MKKSPTDFLLHSRY